MAYAHEYPEPPRGRGLESVMQPSVFVLQRMCTAAVCVCCFAHLQVCLAAEVWVDCRSEPSHMVVGVREDPPFRGLLYVSGRYGEPNCTARGPRLRVPYRGCGTRERRPGLFLTHVTVQHRPQIVGEGDAEYEVGCRLFSGEVTAGADSEPLRVHGPPSAEPRVQLRIYDFENDVFVDTVRLGQVLELEVTVRDERGRHEARISECDALDANGTRFRLIDHYCPVDLSLSDRAYVDDQRTTTGDFYVYVPFRVFRFLDGARVTFRCDVLLCASDRCPAADCGDFVGTSYGRRKRDASTAVRTVTRGVTVVDVDHRAPRSAGFGTVEEEPPSEPKPRGADAAPPPVPGPPAEYLAGAAALVLALLVSLCANAYLLAAARRRGRPPADPQRPEWSGFLLPRLPTRGIETREILYPPMPVRSARRSHSFRY